jgi:hypothetical protein
MFELEKTIYTLDRAATVIGSGNDVPHTNLLIVMGCVKLLIILSIDILTYTEPTFISKVRQFCKWSNHALPEKENTTKKRRFFSLSLLNYLTPA